MVRAKNWSKIALAWNRNFNTLKQSTSQRELQIASISKQSQELKESNSKYIITNQTLDKRITELNTQAKEKDYKYNLYEKGYKELETKYKEIEHTNHDLYIDVDTLTKDIETLKNFIEESEKEKARLKEQILTRKKKAKKPKI